MFLQSTIAQTEKQSPRFLLGIKANLSYENNFYQSEYPNCYLCTDLTEINYSTSVGIQFGLEINQSIRIKSGVEFQPKVVNKFKVGFSNEYYNNVLIYEKGNLQSIGVPISIAVKLRQRKNRRLYFETGLKLKHLFFLDFKRDIVTSFFKINMLWSIKNYEIGLSPTFAFTITPVNMFYHGDRIFPYQLGLTFVLNRIF